MAIPIPEFLKYVRPDFPECPEPILIDTLKWAYAGVCTEAELIEDSVSVPLVIGTNSYTLTSSLTNYKPQKVKNVKLVSNNQFLFPTFLDDLRLSSLIATSGTPAYFAAKDPTSIIIAPVPNAADVLNIVLIVVPTNNVYDVDDRFGTVWLDVIIHYTKARLFSMANQPWFSAEMSAYHRARAAAEVLNLKVLRNEGWISKPLYVRQKPFE